MHVPVPTTPDAGPWSGSRRITGSASARGARTREKRSLRPLLGIALALSACATAPDDPGAFDLDRARRAEVVEIFEAEDRRGTGPLGIDPLLDGLHSEVPLVRRLAVRGLGRLERPDLAETISAVITGDPDAAVRAEAANALGQALGTNELADPPESLIAATGDPEPGVRGFAAMALGKLTFGDPLSAGRARAAILRVAGDPSVEAQLGAARALEARLRRRGRRAVAAPATIARLRAWLATEPGGDSPAGEPSVPVGTRVRIRRLAAAALGATGEAPSGGWERLLADPDPEVRRLAVDGLERAGPGPDPAAVDRALADPSPRVRIAAVAIVRRCPPLLETLDDPATHVRLRAIDVLPATCGSTPETRGLLLDAIARVPEDAGATGWHEGAHALVALTRLEPSASREARRRLATHPRWQVRVWAARAAAVVGETGTLRELAVDEHPNVREAALGALVAAQDAAVPDLAARALASPDHQLLRTAARALADVPALDEGVRSGAAPPPEIGRRLMDALERVTATRRQTSRDPRMALLDALERHGDEALSDRLRPLLGDFDPLVARRAADLLEDWTGAPADPDPAPMPRIPLPGFDDLLRLQTTVVEVAMESGGGFVVELYPFVAPTNAARFARLADRGTFDGLTFHRVVPNFVVQGGSPGANEYAGHGAYTRDEVSARSHLRGTVGVSTRGRDTGDGQFFINLVDNVRLDHQYTIFGRVIEGMETVDAIVEGAVIRTVRLR